MDELAYYLIITIINSFLSFIGFIALYSIAENDQPYGVWYMFFKIATIISAVIFVLSAVGLLLNELVIIMINL